MSQEPVLKVENLCTHFTTDEGVIKAVDGVNFEIEPGGIMALVGESGSGKSVTGLSIMRLIPNPPGKIVGGRVLFMGEDLLTKSEKEMRSYRGSRISMIFQNPMTALDPSFSIGDQIVETILLHQKLSRAQAEAKAVETMQLVGIPDPRARLGSYSHSMSGGMRQRVMIAMALSCNPSLLIADEPTTALDATVQAQILSLLEQINQRLGTAILFITHDFGVVARLCKTVAVMYAGRIIEYADVNTVLDRPQHPYTMGLIGSVPRVGAHRRTLGPDGKWENRQRLFQIDGQPPNLASLPSGCAFAPRCGEVSSECWTSPPGAVRLDAGHIVRCYKRGSDGSAAD